MAVLLLLNGHVGYRNHNALAYLIMRHYKFSLEFLFYQRVQKSKSLETDCRIKFCRTISMKLFDALHFLTRPFLGCGSWKHILLLLQI